MWIVDWVNYRMCEPKMGTIQEEYIIVQTYDDAKGIKKIDKWIDSLPSHWKKQFAKIPSIMNGYLTYFMNWDGSKEWWTISNTGEKVRDCFCAIVNKSIPDVDILHILPKGELVERAFIDKRNDTKVFTNEEIFQEENEEETEERT